MQYLPKVMHSQTVPSEQVYSTLDTTSGFFQTLGVFTLTLVISEGICLLFLHLVSRITWYSFYADFPSQLFMMEMTAAEESSAGIKEEQMLAVEKEELDKIFVTTRWSCGSNMHCLCCHNDSGEFEKQQCAICLCDYGELTKEFV